jgi:DNA-binding CsgD family transcriptional regulator
MGFSVDPNGVILSWNEDAERVLGWRAEEVLGRSCFELLAGRDLFGNRYCGGRCPIRSSAAGGVPTEPYVVVMKGAVREHAVCVRAAPFPQPGPAYSALVHAVEEREDVDASALLRLRDAVRSVALPTDAADNPLTAREREILALLAEGAAAKLAATRLGVSRATVRNHIQNILRKLGVHGQVEAVSVAFRRGWL